jgi:hypothetical protein
MAKRKLSAGHRPRFRRRDGRAQNTVERRSRQSLLPWNALGRARLTGFLHGRLTRSSGQGLLRRRGLLRAARVRRRKKDKQRAGGSARRAIDASRGSRRESEHACGLGKVAQRKGIAF